MLWTPKSIGVHSQFGHARSSCPPSPGHSPVHPRVRPRGRYGRRVDTRIGRIPIRAVAPQQPENRWPAKSFVGEVVPFEATVFREGHGELHVEVLLTDPSGAEIGHRMRPIGEGTD